MSQPPNSTQTDDSTPTKGSCLCRQITYTLTGAALFTSMCHCTSCRKATGSLFTANSGYTKAQLTITSGQDQLKTYDDKATTSGATLQRQFCSNCGSLLFTISSDHPQMGEIVIVYSGSMDLDLPGKAVEGAKGKWEPKYEFFHGRRMEWLPEFPTKERLERGL